MKLVLHQLLNMKLLANRNQIFFLIYMTSLSIQNLSAQSFFIHKADETPAIEKLFHIYTITSLSTNDELVESISGSQKFAVLVNLKPKLRNSIGMDLFFSINALNLKPTGIPADSLDLVSLMFPESGNAGFVFSPQINWARWGRRNRNNFYSEASFSFRNTKVTKLVDDVDSGFSFAILNYNIMPIVYTFNYTNGDDFNGNIMIGPYMNFFNVPNEDAINFNSLFDKEDPIFLNPKKSMVYSIGSKFQLSLNGFVFFIDLRNNYTSNLRDENPYKGFIFNTGFNTSLKVFSK